MQRQSGSVADSSWTSPSHPLDLGHLLSGVYLRVVALLFARVWDLFPALVSLLHHVHVCLYFTLRLGLSLLP